MFKDFQRNVQETTRGRNCLWPVSNSTQPVKERVLHSPSSETGPGGASSASLSPPGPRASLAHPQPRQGASSLSPLTVPHRLRRSRLELRRHLLFHSTDVVPGARLRRPQSRACATQSQSFREAGAAGMNSFFPPLGALIVKPGR